MPRYSLIIINNSAQFENLSVYQSPPDLGNANAINLAWLAGAGEPGAALSFDWSIPSAPKSNKFTAQPKYWVASGKFEPGEISDPGQMTDAVEVVFPPGIYAMHVTLNPDNTWTVALTG